MSIIGEASSCSGVCWNIGAIDSAVLRDASFDSEITVMKTKLLMRTASGLRPSRLASSRMKLTFSRNESLVIFRATSIDMYPRLPASGMTLT